MANGEISIFPFDRAKKRAFPLRRKFIAEQTGQLAANLLLNGRGAQLGRKILAALVNFNSQGIELVGVVDNHQWKNSCKTFLNGDGWAQLVLEMFDVLCKRVWKKERKNRVLHFRKGISRWNFGARVKGKFLKKFCPSLILELIHPSRRRCDFKRDLVSCSKISLDPRYLQNVICKIWLSIIIILLDYWDWYIYPFGNCIWLIWINISLKLIHHLFCNPVIPSLRNTRWDNAIFTNSTIARQIYIKQKINLENL